HPCHPKVPPLPVPEPFVRVAPHSLKKIVSPFPCHALARSPHAHSFEPVQLELTRCHVVPSKTLLQTDRAPRPLPLEWSFAAVHPVSQKLLNRALIVDTHRYS